LIKKVVEKFLLIQDRKVFYCNYFSIRFSYSGNGSFSNTILSLSNLKKYDNLPFIVCLTTKEENILYLANSTFLKKISHSSKELRCDNIK
jgi:sulfatase maturation enzyme AslB (radical SAM superfamily)